MNNDEVNRYIHEEILDKGCWHFFDYPDYCSDSSPRSLLREVVFVGPLGNARRPISVQVERALE